MITDSKIRLTSNPFSRKKALREQNLLVCSSWLICSPKLWNFQMMEHSKSNVSYFGKEKLCLELIGVTEWYFNDESCSLFVTYWCNLNTTFPFKINRVQTLKQMISNNMQGARIIWASLGEIWKNVALICHFLGSGGLTNYNQSKRNFQYYYQQ